MDYSAADEIARVFREDAAPIIAQHFHADTYAIYSVAKSDDGYGGEVTTEALVESGRCAFQTYSPTWGGEKIASGVFLADTKYAVELPRDTALTTNHVIAVNGRRFDVSNVVRPGNSDMFTYAALDEEGPRNV